MERQVKSPLARPPFKFAVLFSAILAISPDHAFGQDKIKQYSEYYDHSRDIQKEAQTQAELVIPGQRAQLVMVFQDLVAQVIALTVENGDLPEEDAAKEARDISSLPRVFHPFMTDERVSIPTVHISGKADPYKQQSEIGRRLCEKDAMRFIEHCGGHDIPEDSKDVGKVIEGIEWAMQLVSLPAFQQ